MKLHKLMSILGDYYYINGDVDVFVENDPDFKEEFEIDEEDGSITFRTL